MTHDLLVIGAGVAGLSLARALQAQGRQPLVLERSRGIGGRCATRRLDGQPVDHGLAFLHGSDSRFHKAVELAARDGVVLPDWPARREGGGRPCRPEAFDGPDRRWAFGDGVNAFAKSLADGIEVQRKATVTGLALRADARFEVTLEGGALLAARDVVLALPAPAAGALLATMRPLPAQVAAALPVLDLVRMIACLTVIARYPAGVPAPPWDASYPGDSPILQAIFHDSAKRGPGAPLVLVIQAGPTWSRQHVADAPDEWSAAMLVEAARVCGGWAGAPETAQPHRWGAARVAPGTELAGPVLLELPGGARLGLAGDGFHPRGGVEGAWLSGVELARQFVARGAAPTESSDPLPL